MRTHLVLYLFLIPCLTFAQKEDRFSITFQITPELTFHPNKYSYNTSGTKTVSTFNCGAQALLQYDLSKSLFLEGGLGYISRTINSTVPFNQSAIPPPRQSFTEEYVSATQVSYRTLQFPLIVGYNLVSTSKTKLYFNSGIIGNFLINANYEMYAKRYAGTYEKYIWQGHTIQLGSGLDFIILKTVWMTTGVSYSIVNTVKKDPYLYGKNSYDGVALTHSYLNMWIGVKIPLKP